MKAIIPFLLISVTYVSEVSCFNLPRHGLNLIPKNHHKQVVEKGLIQLREASNDSNGKAMPFFFEEVEPLDGDKTTKTNNDDNEDITSAINEQTKLLMTKLIDESTPEINSELNNIAAPLFGREIQKGVSKETLKGAALAGVGLSLITNFNPLSATILGFWTAYVAITPGKTGTLARILGDAAWDSTQTVINTGKKVTSVLGIRIPFMTPKTIINGQVNGNKVNIIDDDIVNLVEEAKKTVKEVETVLSSPIDDTKTVVVEKEKLAEEERLEKDNSKEADQANVSIEESENKQVETVLSSPIDDTKTVVVEKEKLAEEERLEKENAKEADEANISIEESDDNQADSDDDNFIDDLDWEASIQLADNIDYLEDDKEGFNKEDWNAARQLANDLTDDSGEDKFDYDAPGLTEEERMELIAKAARAAVEQFEAERQEEEVIATQEKDTRNKIKQKIRDSDVLNIANNEINIEGMKDTSDDYENMTVNQLKDILRSRGLKLSGRKVELIERLRSE